MQLTKHFLFFLYSITLASFTNTDSFPYSKIVLFGDSLTDDGSGVYSFSGGMLPLPPYSEGRYSNGPVWIEYLAQYFNLDYECQVTNYAYGGACVDADVLNFVPSLMATVNDYLISQRFNISSYDADTTLYIVFGGGNDVHNAILNGMLSNQTVAQTLYEDVPYLIQFITKRIVDAGGKHVVVFTLAPNPIRETYALNEIAELMNITLTLDNYITSRIDNLRNSSGVNIQLYDSYDFWLDTFENPEKYGFKNSTGYCFQNWLDFMDGTTTTGEEPNVCEDPNDYIYWDGTGHPTTKFHEAWAGDIEKKMRWK